MSMISTRCSESNWAVAALAFALLLGAPAAAVGADGTDGDASAPLVVAQAAPGADAQATDADSDEPVDDDVDEEAAAASEQGSTLQRGGRMEFDSRLVRGERAGSGAVFLFQRPPRALPSMLERRTSYLDGTVHQVLGDEGVERLDEARSGD